MFFSKTAIGEVVKVSHGHAPELDQAIPVLVVKALRKEKQFVRFFTGREEEDKYQGLQLYFQLIPIKPTQISLNWRKGKYINSIVIDAHMHITALVGMVRSRQITVVLEKDFNDTIKGTPFLVGSAIDQFLTDFKDPLLVNVMRKVLREKGKDVSAAPSLTDNMWSAFDQMWIDSTKE